MATIHIHTGIMKDQSIDFDNPIIFIGRSPGNDIQIKEKSVSRKHLKISIRKHSLFIEDLKSQNGTFINERQIDPGNEFVVDEGIPFTIGDIQISISLNKEDEDILSEYWMDFSTPQNGKEKVPIHKDRRLTDRSQLELIYEVSTMLMQSLDVNEICDKIMNSLFQCLERLDNGIILLADEHTGNLKEVISKTRDCVKNAKNNSYSRTIVDRVIREGKAVIMADTSLEDRDNLSKSIELMQLKSLMCVPLICKSRILGVIYVHSIKTPYGFRKEDLYLFTGLSSPAALAIENALLYTSSKETEEALKISQQELGIKVEERTAELSEANKNLRLAYSQMRDYKDRLSNLLQGEERGFLINDLGQIMGATEKAIKSAGMSRPEIIGSNLYELVHNGSAVQLRTDVKNALKGVFVQTFIQIKGDSSKLREYYAKLMHIHTETGKMIILLIRQALPGERTFRKELGERED